MARVPFVDLSAQYATIKDEIDVAISDVVRGTHFILGQDVKAFEEAFATFCGATYAVGVDSGTSALELSLRAYGVEPGDEVITAANTFIATTFAISYTGATPVLVDIDPQTYTLDVSLLEKAITAKTKAIIPVHLYGQPADMEPILDIARRRHLIVIEDACQAHGAMYKEKYVGALGNAAAFSFYPAKNLGAYGDGGIIVTNDEEIANCLRMLRDYGQREKYHHELQGYNRRLDTIQAAVLKAKLPHLEGWNAARRQHAEMYSTLLSGNGIVTPVKADYATPVYHLYVIRVENRNELKDYLQERGVATGIHYPIPIHLQTAYRCLGYGKGSFPITERYAEQILSLPMYAELTPQMIEQVTEAITEFTIEHKVRHFVPESTP